MYFASCALKNSGTQYDTDYTQRFVQYLALHCVLKTNDVPTSSSGDKLIWNQIQLN